MALSPTELESLINASQADQAQVNDFGYIPCSGTTLADLRQKLRNILSSYAENTLISNDPANDVEKQFINDGISQLYPHDWQAVNYTLKNDAVRTNRFYLPEDTEHVLEVFTATQDINNNSTTMSGLPHGEAWSYDKSYIDAISPTLVDGESWVDTPKKALWLKGYFTQTPWIVVRYARKWPVLKDELSCVDPSPNRITAIVFYAAAQYFISQFQVNVESIRYRNYQAMAQQFLGLYQQQLIKDSKPLYVL